MSERERPDAAAFQELEGLVRNLGDELASMRRRALLAEARLKELESVGSGVPVQPKLADRISRLERENSRLRERLDKAKERSKVMLDRVHFLRQQVQTRGGR
jgi:predicted nuclease with TOPRIM domain